MNKSISKLVSTCALAVGLAAAGTASAAPFNDFKVDPPGPYANFTADKIIGNYVEVVTFNPGGTFDVSLFWSASQFVKNDGTSPISNMSTGLQNTYQLYALYKATGFVTVAGSATTFHFLPGTGSLTLKLDVPAGPGTITDLENYTAPLSGTGDFIFANSADDKTLANGNPVSGLGTLDPLLPTCGADGINCGSFGASNSLSLTLDGSAFFIDPVPFYNLSFQSGQLNNFTPSGTQTINGSLDVAFANVVPEPGSVALLGLGLMGLALSSRRRPS